VPEQQLAFDVQNCCGCPQLHFFVAASQSPSQQSGVMVQVSPVEPQAQCWFTQRFVQQSLGLAQPADVAPHAQTLLPSTQLSEQQSLEAPQALPVGAHGPPHVPLWQMAVGLQGCPSFPGLPVSLHVGTPPAHAILPVWHWFWGVHGAPSMHGPQLPPSQIMFVPHDAPSFAGRPVS
jgi:hypothetical protein